MKPSAERLSPAISLRLTRKHLRRATASLLLALSVTTSLSPALAQKPPDPVVKQLKKDGDRAIESGNYEQALEAYSKALAIEPSPALHYNRGRALQGLGRSSEAMDEFERFDSTAPAKLKAAVPEFREMLERVRRQIVEVSVACDVPDAVLHVGSRSLALPLRQPLRLDPGTVTFVVEAPGHETWQSRITLEAGARRELAPRLERRDLRATIAITSPIAGAFVHVDGQAAGTVPIELRLAPGEHSVRLAHPGYETASTRVVLRESEHRSLSLTLTHTPRLYQRWWFWSAVGASVTGAVVVGVALSTERDASNGDIPPGRVTVPLSPWSSGQLPVSTW